MKRLSGFSLLEVVISLFVIGVVIIMGTTLLKATVLSRHTKFESNSLSIASNKLESLRALGYTSLPASATFTDSLMASLPNGSGSFAVTSYSSTTKKVVVTVFWKEAEAATTSVAVTTLVTSVGGLK